MYEPVLMSKKSFDKLNKQQQDVLIKAGKKSEEYFAKESQGARRQDGQDLQGQQGRSRHPDARPSTTPGSRSPRKAPTPSFAKEVPDGKKLIDEALAVK